MMLNSPDGDAGKKGYCQGCGQFVEIPFPEHDEDAGYRKQPARPPAPGTMCGCPHSGAQFQLTAALAGQTIECGSCHGQFSMPKAPSPPPAVLIPHAEPPPRRKKPSRVFDEDDYDDDDRRRRGPGFSCPYCGSTHIPEVRSRVSGAGWAVFVVLLITCFPLFFIGLLIKEEYRVCYDCGMTVGT
jgi:hypothetical protein